MTTACTPIGSPPAPDFMMPKEEWPDPDDEWSTLATVGDQPDLGSMTVAEEGEFKPDLYLLLDGVLPSTIEDWETELQKAGPIINDLFIGHVTKVRLRQTTLPVKEEPRSVVFVGPVEGGALNSYGAIVDNAQHQSPHTALYHPGQHGPRIFSTTSAIATTPTSPHRFHHTFGHGNAASSFSPLYSQQSTSSARQQPAHEPTLVFDDELHFAHIPQQSGAVASGHYSLTAHQSQHAPIPEQGLAFEQPSLEASSLENEDDPAAALWQGIDNVLLVMSSPSASSVSSSPSSTRSQEEIFEEIQRECAEIEERHSSVSPPAGQSPSTSLGPMKRSPRSSRATNSASPFATSDLRKKELNRIAAIKYRERRRHERVSATSELTQLEARNRELLADYASVGAEIKYLKKLIDEINARAAS